jgi:integrase
MQYLKRAFDLAVLRKYMQFNLLAMMEFDPYLSPEQESLTLAELKKVIGDPTWDKTWLTEGVTRYPLPYCFRDILLLLVWGCKRRSDVCKLRIENVNFEWHFAYYREEKNRSKSGVGSIGKAFWLTTGMENLLRRVIGERKTGYVFASPWDENDFINPDLISERFDETVKKLVPKKHLTLKNLRQTAYKILEDSKKISIAEIDIVLGHYMVKTALPFYQDRSIESRGKRLSEQNRKGVEILYRAVKEFFD